MGPARGALAGKPAEEQPQAAIELAAERAQVRRQGMLELPHSLAAGFAAQGILAALR